VGWAVIGSTRRIRVFIHREPTDMRKAYDTLGAIVVHQLHGDVLSGDLFLFVGKDKKRAKVLYFDGTGMCLFSKRMDKGSFMAPWEANGRAEMTSSELALFLEGARWVGHQPLSPPALRPDELFLQPGDFV
jgi:transposase